MPPDCLPVLTAFLTAHVQVWRACLKILCAQKITELKTMQTFVGWESDIWKTCTSTYFGQKCIINFKFIMKSAVFLSSAGFLLRLLFNAEDSDDMLLRNVGLSPNYTASEPRRKPHSSPPREPQIESKPGKFPYSNRVVTRNWPLRGAWADKSLAL
jgi:hypothetical protein